MLTRDEAVEISRGIVAALPERLRERFKAVHVMSKLHSGHMTIRVFAYPLTAEDPDPFIFAKEDLDGKQAQ